MKIRYSGLFNRALLLGLVATMIMSLVSCGDSEEENTSEKSYTYNTYMESSPESLNPHTRENSEDNSIALYTEMGLVDITADDNGDFQWTFEMAENIKDVTADFQDKEKYGISANETGRVWQISLNKEACFEDGTPINADTYINSMKLLLDPNMNNHRAEAYYDYNKSDIAIYNAMNYFYPEKNGEKILYSFSSKGFETVEDAINSGYTMEQIYLDMSGFWNITPEGTNGMVSITDDTKYRDESVAEGENGDYVSAKLIYNTFLATGKDYETSVPGYLYVADGQYEQVTFEQVGLVKVDDYTFQYITVNPVHEFYFYANMTSNWIVNEDIYNKGKSEKDGQVETTYGTSVKTYMSYGPYKLITFEKDKQIVMIKNDKWYGYNDNNHKGQFQTTKIIADIVPEHSEQIQMFLSGQLDSINLNGDDMKIYSASDRLYSTYGTYTSRWVFATDIDALTKLELDLKDGTNKRVLSYDDFRKAMSRAIDRERFVSETAPGYEPVYYLLNDAFYTDITENADSQYRKSDEAKQALLNVYKIKYGEEETYKTLDEAYKSISGYNLDEAKALFQSVYDQAIADGNYTEGQNVEIRCMVSSASSLSNADIARQDLLNQMLGEATKGTGFDGKIQIKFMCGAKDRYKDCATGKIEMICSAWAGDTFYPTKVISLYTDPMYNGGFVHEQCGWDPTVDTLDITYDFDGDGTAETLTKTYQQWAQDINSSNVYGGNAKIRLVVLSALESGVLSEYQCIPWATDTSSSLLSYKCNFGYEEYNVMYGFGGIRYMTYNYDDDEWTDYLKEQGGILDYK